MFYCVFYLCRILLLQFYSLVKGRYILPFVIKIEILKKKFIEYKIKYREIKEEFYNGSKIIRIKK